MTSDTPGGDDRDGELVAAARMGRREGVRWAGIDRALAGFTAESLLAVVGAALDSPWCRPWEYHLALVWVRTLRRRPVGTTVAQAADLVGLLSAAMRAAVARQTLWLRG